MDGGTYKGVWIDRTYGQVHGSRLTLNDRDGAILLACLVLFVTLAAGQSWKILAFAVHQFTASPRSKDTVHFQRQSIFKNSATATSALWLLILQGWTWRKGDGKAIRRTTPFILLTAIHAIIFTLATVLGARFVTTTSPTRLLTSQNCGFTDHLTAAEVADLSFLPRRTREMRSATSYARNCYGAESSSRDCDAFAQSTLRYTVTPRVKCPFTDDICWRNYTVRLQSGMIDSHKHLGINARNEHSLKFRQRSTCAVLKSQGYARTLDADEISNWDANSLQSYNYGSTLGEGDSLHNYTHLYVLNKAQAAAANPYTVSAYWSLANGTGGNWNPIPALASSTADTMIAFVEINSVTFSQPNDDPIFGANEATEFNGETVYGPDYLVAPVACQEEIQVCTNSMSQCTPWTGRGVPALEALETLNMNDQQQSTLLRLHFATLWGHMHWAIMGAQSRSLLAYDTLFRTQQISLQPDQWIRELSAWFDSSLAHLQYKTHEYAFAPDEGSNLRVAKWQPWQDKEFLSGAARAHLKDMCSNQITRDSRSSVSFSVLALGLTFALALSIIVASFIVEPLVMWIHGLHDRGRYKKLAWISDGFLQVQHMLLEARGVITSSEELTTNVPTAGTYGRFSGAVLFPGVESVTTCDSEMRMLQTGTPTPKAWAYNSEQ